MTDPRSFDTAWTLTGNEIETLKGWFEKSVSTMRSVHIHDREPTIVDFNVNGASVELLKNFVLLGRRPIYLVVDQDPNIPAIFQSHIGWTGEVKPTVRHFPGTLGTFAPGGFDLAIVNGVLPYTASLDDAVRRAVDRAKSVLFIQPGERGLLTIRRQFSHLFGDYPNLATTGENVKNALKQINLQGRDVREAHPECQVNVNSCLDPQSEQGQRILEFVFNRPYAELTPNTLAAVRSFLTDTYGRDNYIVTHDIDIIYVS